MRQYGHFFFWSLFVCSVLLQGEFTLADGVGVLIQRQGDEILLGYDSGSGDTSIGAGAFGGVVDGDGLTQEPSFLSLATPPSGSQVLPIGESVFWDFLPITADGVTSNLMWWDGVSDFSLAPAVDASLTLYDPVFLTKTVTGLAAAVPGLRIGTVADDSPWMLHAHRLWGLEGEGASDAAEGVYVTAMRVRIDGLKPSDPFFVAIGTPGMSDEVNGTAIPWIEENSDSLLLSGDYNFNGVVDMDDHDLWAAQYGATTPQDVAIGEADGNRDGVIDAADYTVWRDAYAAHATSAFAIPEPNSLLLVAMAFLGVSKRPRKP